MQTDLYGNWFFDEDPWNEGPGPDTEGYSPDTWSTAAPLGPVDRALQELTAQQLEGVTAPDGPLLLLSGAGTGKTKTLTLRIAHRLQAGDLHPAHFLALTFTRKAAAEMARRLEQIVGRQAKAMDIGTFHNVFAKALRACDGEGGIPADFTLLDDTDQHALLKDAAASISPDYLATFKAECKTRDVLTSFSKYTLSLYPGEPEFTNPANVPGFATLLRAYERLKKANNVLDYDDVLTHFDRILDLPHIRHMFQRRWRHVSVDEYQDTNAQQESILRKIAGRHRCIVAVGDDDQAIYSFRGAKVSNILDFQERWLDARIIRLEHNFRSREPILAVANAIIANNKLRHGKTLVPTRGPGDPATLSSHKDAFEEARAVSRAIAAELRAGRPPSEIAVIARTAGALAEVQRQLLADGIRYVMHAGSNVADKIETKLIAAWIRCAVNTKDEAAFLYAFNDQARSVGKKGLAIAKETARQSGATVEAVLRQTYRGNPANEKLIEFLDDIAEVRALARIGETPAEIVNEIVERSGIGDKIAKERQRAASADTRDEREKLTSSAMAREQNLALLIEHAGQVDTLSDLAANIVLSNETVTDEGGSVWLGTIHASKALEFETVFLPAFENGILPSPRVESGSASPAYEEERNLAFVATTRAKERLRISFAEQRTLHGREASGGPSPFAAETGIPPSA